MLNIQLAYMSLYITHFQIIQVVKVVLLCGKQGLALCGHQDDHIEWEEEVTTNEGNFIELVRFRAETDETLKHHLRNAP